METYIEIRYNSENYNSENVGKLYNAVCSSKKQLDEKEETLENGYNIYFENLDDAKKVLQGVAEYLKDSWDDDCETDFKKDLIAWDVLYKNIKAVLTLKDVDDIKEE
jgi:hypothetical protein